MREILLNFCSTTTILAISKLVSTTRFIFKIIYGIACIVSVCLFLRSVWLSTENFLKYEVDTVISSVNIVDETEFPSITICILQVCGFTDYDYNRYLDIYKAREKEKFGYDKSEEIEVKLRKNRTKTSYYLAREVFLREYNDVDLVKILTQNKTTISDSDHQQLIRCTLAGKKCDENDFEYFSVGEFQKCYRFNSGSYFNGSKRLIDQVGKFGEANGLELEVYIGNRDQCKSPLSTSSGLSVYVHNSTYTLTEDDNAILVHPGTTTSIEIEKTFVKQLASPYSDCFLEVNEASLKRSALIRKTVELSNIYTQQYCLHLCFEEFLLEFCECYDQALPNFQPANFNVCPKFIDSIYNCEYLIKRLFYNGKNDQHCLRDCPKECEYISYETTVFNSRFPSEGYKQLLNKRLNTSEKSADGMVSIKAFYKNSKLNTKIEEAALTGSMFIGELGGVLGFFLGCSILSGIEIIEALLNLVLKIVVKIKLKIMGLNADKY